MDDWRKNEQRYGAETYSQHGEDIMLLNIFDLLGIEKPSYLDLGAHHPVTISNTKLLYDRGSRGVNIEANPNLLQSFKRLRPDDKNIFVGVGPRAGKLPFYMIDGASGLNSFVQEEITRFGFQVSGSMDVDVLTIDEIVNRYCGGQYPALLLSDIEGLDYEVLETANFRTSKPQVICSEVRQDQGDQFARLMGSRGYFRYCRLYANVIYVLDELRSKLY